MTPYLTEFVSAYCSKPKALRERAYNSQCTLSHHCLEKLAIRALKSLARFGHDYWGSVASHPPGLPSPIKETVVAVAQAVIHLWNFLLQPQLITIAQGVVLTLENYLISPPDIPLNQNTIIYSSLPCADEQSSATPSTKSCPSATVVDAQGTRSTIVSPLLFAISYR